MDNNSDEKNLVQILEDLQKEFPDLVLPNMGIIDNEEKININAKDYLKDKSVREE